MGRGPFSDIFGPRSTVQCARVGDRSRKANIFVHIEVTTYMDSTESRVWWMREDAVDE